MYEAINARDYEAGFALLTDDFVWHRAGPGLPRRQPSSGSTRFASALEAQLEVFDEFTIEPEEFHEHGEPNRGPGAPARTRRGERSRVEIRIGHLWTLRDGKIARLDVFGARDDALRALEVEGTD